MKKNILLFVLGQLLLINSLVAQTTPFSCGADEISKKALLNNPDLKHKHSEFESAILKRRLSQKEFKIMGAEEYIIPVVVHIIHNNGPENITNAQVLTGIQHLNDAFNNENSYYRADGTAIGIKFCLAKQDEHGTATSGITRTVSHLTDVLSPSQDLDLKNLIRWDPSKYINIWLVNEITSESSGAGVAGYAYFPSAHGGELDGVVNEARYFGTTIDNSKVHIHELGHYLGLYHTFEGGCTNNNCLTDGDRVCDTPPDASSAPMPCNSGVNTCTTDADDLSANNPYRPVALGGLGDQNDMLSNYMDYGLDLCRYMFTQGQKDRMIAALTLTRASLLNSKGCEDLCPSPIALSFASSATEVELGDVVTFTNTSTGASDYQWYVKGTQIANTTNATYTFSEIGKHVVVLRATNEHTVCTKEDSIEIQVNCTVRSVFSSPQKIKPNEEVFFINNTLGANSYQWLIDGAVVTTTQDFRYTFTSVGGFMLSLVSYNGTCYDTLQRFVQVSPCSPGNNGNTWYFGNWIKLTFENGQETVSLLPIALPTINLRSDEAAVSMSDASGNFLFFANPNFVFNKNQDVMPNGSGLLGNYSATQMAVVQKPGDPSFFYLFTLDALGGPNGLRYSEIDMTLNGGLGDVVAATKNTFLQGSMTEKVTSVKHANGIDTWVIAHEYGTNAFYSYLVTSAGINTTPVISAVGSVHANNTDQNVLGQLKASPNGCKLAVAISAAGIVELLSFDNLTGTISNPITLTGPDYKDCYGIEFSSDGSKLYAGMEKTRNIYQFDITSDNATTIANSKYFVANTGTIGFLGSFQVGPYGKIYVARSGDQHVGIIHNPNASGANCQYQNDGIYLGARPGTASLPAFNQSYFYDPTPSIAGPDTVCANSKNVSYRISGSGCSASVNVWTLLGNATIATSDDTLVQIDFAGAGIDTLIIERTSACGKTYDTLQIVVKEPAVPATKDTVQCGPNALLLDAGADFVSYLWHDNSTAQTYTAASPGKYWVTLTTAYGCSVTDTFQVLPEQAPVVSLGNDTTFCEGTVFVLNAGTHKSYRWQDNSSEQTYTVFGSGKYWVRVTNECGIANFDTITIFPEVGPVVSLGNDTTICDGATAFLLDAGVHTTYRWQDNSSAQTYSVLGTGKYWVTVANECGTTASDTIEVVTGSSVDLGENKAICPDEIVVLKVENGFKAFVWSDGSTQQTLSVAAPGVYWVTATNISDCISADTIVVSERMDCCSSEMIPNLVTANNDGLNDVFTLPCQGSRQWSVEIYNRWGNLVYRAKDYQNDWPFSTTTEDVYYYHVISENKNYKGWVQVIR